MKGCQLQPALEGRCIVFWSTVRCRHLSSSSQHEDVGDTTLPIPVLGRSLAAGTVLAGSTMHMLLG